MTPWRLSMLFSLCLAAALAAGTSQAREIYRWVDENGVVHFSDEAPPETAEGVKQIEIDEADSNAPADDDPFNVEATAERMQAYREEMERRRESQRAAQLEREKIAAQRPAVQYQRVGYRGYPWYARPPLYPVQPIEPPAPAPELYPSVPFRPPGGWQD